MKRRDLRSQFTKFPYCAIKHSISLSSRVFLFSSPAWEIVTSDMCQSDTSSRILCMRFTLKQNSRIPHCREVPISPWLRYIMYLYPFMHFATKPRLIIEIHIRGRYSLPKIAGYRPRIPRTMRSIPYPELMDI